MQETGNNMRILSDGTVEIRNKRTGETKIIQPQDLPSYGIPYSKYAGEVEAAQQVGIDTGIKFKKTTDSKEAAQLRKEFSAETKNLGFEEAQKSWNKASSAQKTGAGDLTIIYSYIKALDPTSVVREGEINLTKAAESIPNRIIKAYQRAKEGKIMSDELRQEMKNELSLLYNERARKQQELNAFYSGLATDMGLDSKDVIGKIGEIKLAPTPEEQRGPNRPTDIRRSPLERLLTPPPQGSQFQEAFSAGAGPLMALLTGTERQKVLAGPAVLAGAVPAAGATIGFGGALGRAGMGALASRFSPTAIAAQRSQEAKKVGNIVTSKMKQLGDFYIKEIDPTVKGEWKQVQKAIKPTTDANVFLQKLTNWGTKARTPRTGEIKSNTVADFYDFLRKSGRQIVETEAPALAKYTEDISFLKNIPRAAGKLTWLGAKAGIAVGGLKGLLGL